MEDLDVTDIEILRLLQADASLTHKEIAFKLHKSVATVHEFNIYLVQMMYEYYF